MEVTSYTHFRQNLKSFLNKVNEEHEPLYVTRSSGDDVVVLSKEDYESIMATLHLMKNPSNAQRIAQGLKDYEQGLGEERKLVE
jgi:antitoxin YefM